MECCIIEKVNNSIATKLRVTLLNNRGIFLKYFLPVRGNLVVVCNLTDVRYSEAFNGVKWVVTHECMSSVFEMLLLFWFVVMSLLSSWDDMDVPVELLADDSWAAEDDKTGLLNVGVDCFGRLY